MILVNKIPKIVDGGLNRMYNVLSNINLTQGTEHERSLIRFS